MKIEFLGPYFEFPQEQMPAHQLAFLENEPGKSCDSSQSELALATARFPIPCNDLFLIDERGRVVLAKRRHAAAIGWWVFGGAGQTDKTAEETIELILKREIGFVPNNMRPVAIYDHFWADCRERAGGLRQDRILAWTATAGEEAIAKIELDPDEYFVEEGLMRFDGSQPGLRPVLYDMLDVIRNAD